MPASYRSLLTVFVLVITIALLSVSGVLQSTNLTYADFLVRRLPESAGLADRTLLIAADPGPPLSAAEWEQLLTLLDGYGAAVIALSTLPSELPATASARHATLMIGTPVTPNALDPARYDLPLQPQPGADDPPLAVAIPAPDFGRYREQYRVVDTARGILDTLETAVVRRMAPAIAMPTTQRYLLDFSYLPGSLPRVEARRALAGGLVSEMVAGRCVLIEVGAAAGAAVLYTPASSRGTLLSALEFHAYALNTLLNGRVIQPMPRALMLAIVLLVAAAAFVGLQKIATRSELTVLLALAAVYVPVSWLIYHHGRLVPPTSEIFLTFIAMLGFVFSERGRRERQMLGTLVLESSVRLQRMVLPTAFYDSAQYWNEVIRMVDQTLSLRRTIFLDRVPGDHRVKEVIALNCAVTDINEKRRDYERTPYTTALAEQGPIQVDAYLRDPAADEQQFLVPLLFAGEVQGFWAFGVRISVLASTAGFSPAVKDFADQIAQLLYHRRLWVERQREERSPLRRFLEMQAGEPEYRRLNNAVALIEQRLSTLEKLFDGLATATILYDLFGRVLQVNRQMSQILKEEGIKPFESTAGDLVSQLADLPLEDVRPLIRRLVLLKQAISLPSRVVRNRYYVMRLRPLAGTDGPEGDELRAGPVLPFQVEGILLELMDITDIRNLRRLKEDLLQRTVFTFNNDIGSGLLAASLLNEPTLPPAQRAETMTILNAKLKDMHQTLYEVRDYFASGLDANAEECYPINVVPSVAAVLVEVADAARQRGIGFSNEIPELLNLVMVLPAAFGAVIRAIVMFLIHDATSESTIVVKAATAEEAVELEFSNTGFGIPQDRMDEYMVSHDEPDSAELRDLRSAAREVTEWGGLIEVQSAVGSGTTVTLTLKALV